MNHNTKVLTAILTTLGTLFAGPLPAADEALLNVLLKNGVITKAQRDALTDGKKGPAKPPDAISAKPAPADDQGLLDVLLENGLISQAQFATLQVKTAQQKRTEHEARASLKDGIKLKSPRTAPSRPRSGPTPSSTRPSTRTDPRTSPTLRSYAGHG